MLPTDLDDKIFKIQSTDYPYADRADAFDIDGYFTRR
jgi:hypothetical protein